MNPSDITRLRELAGKAAAGHPGNYMSVNSADIISLCERVEKLEGALKPFAKYAEIIGDNPPPGNSDIIHAYHCERGIAALRHSDCKSARSILLEGRE